MLEAKNKEVPRKKFRFQIKQQNSGLKILITEGRTLRNYHQSPVAGIVQEQT